MAYDVLGHTFFLEDGAETGNLFEDNLAVLTRRPPEGRGLLDSNEHIGPTSYWITNPDNRFRGNVAAASEGTGFWVALPEHPTGLSETGRVWPRRMRLRQFDGNVAHSNDGDGLRVDNGPKPDGTTEVTVNDPRAVPANPGSRELATGIDRFSAWKNRGSGVWTRLLRLAMTNATLADNPIGVTLVNHDSVVRDSLIVGESANRGTPGPYEKAGAGGRSLPGPGRRTSRSAGSSSTTAATAPSGSTSRGSRPTASGRPAPSPTCASPPSRSTPATGPAGPASARGSTGSTSRTGRPRRPGAARTATGRRCSSTPTGR